MRSPRIPKAHEPCGMDPIGEGDPCSTLQHEPSLDRYACAECGRQFRAVVVAYEERAL